MTTNLMSLSPIHHSFTLSLSHFPDSGSTGDKGPTSRRVLRAASAIDREKSPVDRLEVPKM